ncbi:MAG: hypothetical protein QM237_05130 [Bacteroidota bacterium]|jgi:hypothetical protein|nr:hypothetical protein [Bacteroidota bacterium]HHU95705.1 hypothetical protein [Petrimonas sp.]
MRTKGKTLKGMHLEQVAAENHAGSYVTPQMEVIEIELTQNILQGSGGNAPANFDGYDW